MRIAIFNWRCFRHPQAGGSELYLYEQASIWASQAHEVVWFTSQPSKTKRDEIHDGIRFIRRGGAFSVYMWAAINYFRFEKVDVVIDVENGIPFFAPFYTKAPVVLLIHHIHTDVWHQETSKPTAHVGTLLESKVMPLCYRSTPIVTVSESSADMIGELFGRHGSIDIVYNAISSDLRPGQKADSPEIIYLGRLRRYKSIDVLLEAVGRLGDLAPVVHIVGQGEDEPRLRAIAKSLGIKALFHGYVNVDEKMRLLQRSWVAVNPSSMEGWGITNIEANACGTPVIGSNVPGIRDSIVPGRTGLLVPYGEQEALAEAIRTLVEDEKQRAMMSQAAREWAARFSWEASAKAFMNVLERVVFENHPTR